MNLEMDYIVCLLSMSFRGRYQSLELHAYIICIVVQNSNCIIIFGREVERLFLQQHCVLEN